MPFHNVPPNGFPDLADMEEVEAVVKDVTALKTSVAGLSEDVSDLNSSKANKADIATEFSNLTNYNAGDLVYYDGALYEFQADHTAGDWETSEVIQKDLSDIVTTLKSGLTSVMSNVTFIPHATPGNNPFDTDGTGYVLKVMFGSTHLGYMTIRPKGFVDANNRPIAIELFTPTWGLAWQVLRDNS